MSPRVPTAPFAVVHAAGVEALGVGSAVVALGVVVKLQSNVEDTSVAPVTTAVRVTDCVTTSVPPAGLTVTTTWLALDLLHALHHRQAATATNRMLSEMFRHFITTVSPAFARLSLIFERCITEFPSSCTARKAQTLERPADRKAERSLRLEIVQASWVVLQLQDCWLDLVEPDIRWQSPWQQPNWQTVRPQLLADLARIQVIRRSDNLRMQPVDIVGVVDPEGRLNDWQLNDELDPRRASQPEVRSGGDGKLACQSNVLCCQRELRGQVAKARGVKPQSALPQNAVGSAIQEKPHLHGGADDGDAIFKVPIALRVAARERNGIAQHWHVESSLRWLTKTVETGSAQVGELLRAGYGNKRDRGDGADIESANVTLPAHVEPAVRGRFSAAVSRGESSCRVEAQHIAPLVDRMVVLPIKNVS